MNRDGHSNNKFFVGIEVEKSKFYAEKTLFVVGYQSCDEIIETANSHNVSHIYLGANMSYFEGPDWNVLISFLIQKFNITLDIPFTVLNDIKSDLSEEILNNNKFALMVSVKIPEVDSLPCLHIKIDDVDFKATNSGVWVHSIKQLKDEKAFTHWDDYKGDVVI